MEKLKFDRNRRRVKTCPCGRSNADGKFSPLADDDRAGKCHSCDMFFPPDREPEAYIPAPPPKRAEPQGRAYIPPHLFTGSLDGYARNNFTTYLVRVMGQQAATEAVERYIIGTHGRAVVFWYIDIQGIPRAGKVMDYDPLTGKRKQDVWIRDPITGKYYMNATSMHYLYNLPEGNRLPVLYGEHQLRGNRKPAAVFESEKTATMASEYLPHEIPGIICLATGSKGNLNLRRCQVLKDRHIYLFPDNDGFDLWSEKAEELRSICPSVTVSRVVLEQRGGPNDDLADYLPKLGPPPARPVHLPAQQVKPAQKPPQCATGAEMEAILTGAIWETLDWLESLNHPTGPIDLPGGTRIDNPAQWVRENLDAIRADSWGSTQQIADLLRYRSTAFAGVSMFSIKN